MSETTTPRRNGKKSTEVNAVISTAAHQFKEKDRVCYVNDIQTCGTVLEIHDDTVAVLWDATEATTAVLPIDIRPAPARTMTELLIAASQEEPAAIAEIQQGDPKLAARAKNVLAGFAEFQAICAERDEFRRLWEEERLTNKELHIAIDQAREHERAHVEKVTQELITEGKKCEAQLAVKDDEIRRLGDTVQERDRQILELVTRVERRDAQFATLRAALEAMVTQ